MTPGEDEFLAAVRQNPMVATVLDRLESLALPDGHLAAGCLFQTVWNVLDGQEPERGIGDYDVIYFDDSDLSCPSGPASWWSRGPTAPFWRLIEALGRHDRAPERVTCLRA